MYLIFTARKRSLRRLCFHRCLSVHGGCLPHCMLGYTPRADMPPCGQTTPQTDTHTPLGRHPPPSACWDTVNKRVVRIPLECILVLHMRRILVTKVNGTPEVAMKCTTN